MGIYIKGNPQAGTYKLEYITSADTYNNIKLTSEDGTSFIGHIVETPHGHLKDNDFVVMWGDIEQEEYGNNFNGGVDFMLEYFDALPTIIEGEK